MEIQAYKTKKIVVGDDLFDVADKYLPQLKNGDVVVFTSKIISLCMGDVVVKKTGLKKADIVKEESDHYYDCRKKVNHGIIITLKDGILGASAGVDESNGRNVYIKLPSSPFAVAEKLWAYLKQKNGISQLGIIITDSHSVPFRLGVTGVGIAWCGFYPLCDYGDSPDIWQASMKGTVTNHLDALAAAAVHVMGEGDEQTPLCVISGDSKIIFNEKAPTDAEISAFRVSPSEDIYAPLFSFEKWEK